MALLLPLNPRDQAWRRVNRADRVRERLQVVRGEKSCPKTQPGGSKGHISFINRGIVLIHLNAIRIEKVMSEIFRLVKVR
jgi:hypothetical protein